MRGRTGVLIQIDRSSADTLYRQIYDQIRSAISKGALEEGDRLPSIRGLANDLGISHTTVEQAYLQLATEGFAVNKPRSGFVVARVDAEFLSLGKDIDEQALRKARESRNQDAFFSENRSGKDARYDFSYANLRPDSFPAEVWRKTVNEILHSKSCPELAQYGYTDEPNSLKEELASLIFRTRGARCAPEQIVIQAGTDGALATILQLFDNRSDALGMEEPGYATVHEVARRLRFSMVPLPTDNGTEPFLAALDEHKPKLVFATPSHQFPTGRLLSLDARTRLLKWAERNDAYIIEDDSCNEFRYATSPIPSLQSLDAYGRVIYLGNVSKVLSPSLRIAYFILPVPLLTRYWDLFNFSHPSVSWLEQETLARFMANGHWDAHVRRTAKGNHRCNNELLRCLRTELGDTVDISGADTGMHFYVTVHNGMTQSQLVESAAEQGVKIYGTSRMWFSKPAPENNVLLGFSSITFEDIEPGIHTLAKAWL